MYTTAANISAKLGTSLSADQLDYFTNVLDDAIDSYINRLTGVSFGSTGVVSVYEDGTDSNMLVIPTMHDITEVAKMNSNGTVEAVVPVDEYRTYPQGSVDKLAIRKLNGTWAEGFENYKITGQSGYKTVPGDIVNAATEMAINSLNANVNNYKSEKVGDWAVTYSEAENSLSAGSEMVLANYRRLSRSI